MSPPLPLQRKPSALIAPDSYKLNSSNNRVATSTLPPPREIGRIPCLNSLVGSSPRCPHCRASLGTHSIRKVVCPQQNSSALEASTQSNAERIMWQAIKGAVESTSGYEQRRSLVRDYTRLAVRGPEFSGNVFVALETMRLLVEVESMNRELHHKIEASYAFEESLRDRVSFLEMQLNGMRGESGLQDLEEIEILKSSTRIIDEKAAQLARQISFADPVLNSDKPQSPLHLESVSTICTPERTRSIPQPESVPVHNSPITEPQPPEVSSVPPTPVQPMSPPALVQLTTPPTPVQFASPHTPLMDDPDWPSLSVTSPRNDTQSPPRPSQSASRSLTRPPAPAQPSNPPTQAQVSQQVRSSSELSWSPRGPTATAVYDYTAENSTAISFRAGERLEFVGDSNDLRWGYQLVWCRVGERVGYSGWVALEMVQVCSREGDNCQTLA
ncbi:hypothetical protein BDV93DRAFT_509913 [Ceratobasidium sp. AG-I]|nr:hypothetical protein BDV93DRAFT_509913 [Ceratobasidium sp. AG-I]